jgi:hypothetical protein
VGSGTDRAEAVVITVNGNTYDVFNLGPQGTRFTDPLIQPTLENNVPWWGNPTLAGQFAQAYFDAVVPTASNIIYAFAYGIQATLTGQEVLVAGARSIASGGPVEFFTVNPINQLRTDIQWVAVPEINGPVLAQMGLVLSVLCIGLMAMRRRPERHLSGA